MHQVSLAGGATMIDGLLTTYPTILKFPFVYLAIFFFLATVF